MRRCWPGGHVPQHVHKRKFRYKDRGRSSTTAVESEQQRTDTAASSQATDRRDVRVLESAAHRADATSPRPSRTCCTCVLAHECPSRTCCATAACSAVVERVVRAQQRKAHAGMQPYARAQNLQVEPLMQVRSETHCSRVHVMPRVTISRAHLTSSVIRLRNTLCSRLESRASSHLSVTIGLSEKTSSSGQRLHRGES